MQSFDFIVTEAGKLPEGIRSSLARIIPTFAGKWMVMTLEEREPSKTLSQLAFYRGYVLPHVRKVRAILGDPQDMDDVHEDNLQVFGEHRMVRSIRGEDTLKPIRSAVMTKKQMCDFITAILAEMASLHYPLPVSNEYLAWQKKHL